MKLYQCPIGHPPGPQEFCPICGRRCDPVEAAAPPPPPPSAAEPPSTSWESARSEPADPAPTKAFDLDEPTEGSPPPPLPPPPGAAPPPPPPPPPPPAGPPPSPPSPPPPPSPPGPPSPFTPAPPFGAPTGPGSAEPEAPGAAAAKARDLIAELTGQQPPAGGGPSIPSQSVGGGPLPPAPPGAPASPYLPPGPPVPSFGDRGSDAEPHLPPIPSYAPTEPPGLGFPPPLPGELPDELPAFEEETTSPGQWSDGTTPPPPGRTRRSRDGDAEEIAGSHGEARSRRLPVVLLLVLVLAGAAYLAWSQLLNDDDDGLSTAPPVRRPSAAASVSPSAATPLRTLSAAELASSLKDAHFKHGYEWAKQHGTVAAADREQVCRTEAFKQRGDGYPWGAHDRAGCLIGLAG